MRFLSSTKSIKLFCESRIELYVVVVILVGDFEEIESCEALLVAILSDG